LAIGGLDPFKVVTKLRREEVLDGGSLVLAGMPFPAWVRLILDWNGMIQNGMIWNDTECNAGS